MTASANLRGGMLALIFALVAGGAMAQAPGSVDLGDLKVRAQAGDKTATRQLAETYYLGRGVEQDFAEAARWYLVLAKQGDARAQTSIGLMYARGYGVRKDLATAQKWWSFAAAQNDPGAQYNLGLLYSQGEIPQDLKQAAEWYQRAASRGHVSAQHNLGMMYHDGKGVARDPVRAYFWVGVAAQQGDDVAQDSLKAVARDMSSDEMRQAQRQIDDWFVKAKKVWK